MKEATKESQSESTVSTLVNTSSILQGNTTPKKRQAFEPINNKMEECKTSNITHLSSTEFLRIVMALPFLYSASEATGGYVKLLPENRYCPVLIGDNERIIPLFTFIEVLDEALDYYEIIKRLPGISYTHIHEALNFLRKLSQFNIAGIDFDDLEDEAIAKDKAFLDELRRGFADKETTRVLNHDERNR